MVGNFLNQNPYIQSWPVVFQFEIFLVSFSYCLSIRPFCYVLLVSIFYSRIVQLLLHPVVGMCLCHLPQLVGRIFFHYFGMFCFVCIALTFVDVILIFLLPPALSGLFPQVVLLFFLYCFFLFQRLSFVSSFLSVFVFFFICISSRIQVLIFCSCSLRKPRFSHKSILFLQN